MHRRFTGRTGFGALRRNPAAQIVRQRGVDPIAARLRILILLPGGNARTDAGAVGGREPRLDFRCDDDRDRATFVAGFERVERADRAPERSARGSNAPTSLAERRRARNKPANANAAIQNAAAAAIV